MSFLGNLIWIILGGFIGAIIWFFAGLLFSITIIGIPLGKQCFKYARLQLAPFGTTVNYSPDIGALNIIGNIIWLILFGWELFLYNLAATIIFGVTVIGIPFALQSWKMARLALWPLELL